MTSDKEMYLDDNECDKNRKPATIATCVKMACPKPAWIVHEWSEVGVWSCQSFVFYYEKVQVGKDQEKAQSEKDSHSKNRGGKKTN